MVSLGKKHINVNANSKYILVIPYASLEMNLARRILHPKVMTFVIKDKIKKFERF
jgi:hypothetical protein